MLLRELAGGDPPYTCKVIFNDDPTGFGHRVTEGDRLVEHVLTRKADFDRAVAGLLAEGFAETQRSLTRRVFAAADTFWIVLLDGQTLRVQFGGTRPDWRESSGQTRDKLFRDPDRAAAAYHRAVEQKLAEGCVELYARTVAIPAAPTQPGKKGSR